MPDAEDALIFAGCAVVVLFFATLGIVTKALVYGQFMGCPA